jgi:hypothetical protein
MGRTKDILGAIKDLFISTILSTYYLIECIVTTFGPLILACPPLILVFIALYVIPIITYVYSGYTIMLLYVPFTWATFIVNIMISIYDVLSPTVWPLYALYYNTVWQILFLVIQASYKYFCPGEFPPVDINADCPVVFSLLTLITTYVTMVSNIIDTFLVVVVNALTGIGSVFSLNAVCTNTTCTEDEWKSTVSIIIIWISDLVEWLVNTLLPIVFMTLGFLADLFIFIMSQLIAIILQRLTFIVNLFGGLITLIIPHNPASVPDQNTDPNAYSGFVLGAVQFLQVNQTFTEYSTGPTELKDFYLTILQLVSDIITTIYSLIIGFLQGIDKIQCYLTPAYFGSCVIGNQCRAIFTAVPITLFCDKLVCLIFNIL